MLPRMTSRVGALVSSVLLALGLTVVAVAPAHAAGGTTVSFDTASGLHVVDSRTQSTVVNIGFQVSTSSVWFRSTAGIASWPANCQSVDEPALGQYVYCPGASVAGVVGVFGAGSDTMRVQGVCMEYVGAALGDGSDTFEHTDCPTAATEVLGEGGDDSIVTGNGPDEIDGGPGNDFIRTNGGDDKVSGGDGNDKLESGAGNDTVSGGTGNDAIYPSAGNDVANGDDGDDLLASYQGDPDSGADDLRGGNGTDTIDLGNHTPGATIALDDVANDGNSGEGDNYHSDFERILGSPGADVIIGTNGPDYIKAGTGNDTVQGLGGNDEIDGDSDNDVMDGGAGNDILYGGYGNDDVTGGPGIDSLYGDYTACSAYGCPAGADVLRAADGEVDTVNCGSGADQAYVDGNDVLGTDGFQVCEAVTRIGPVPDPDTNGATVRAGTASRAKGVKATLTCVAACTATAQVVVSKKVQKALKLKSRVLGTARKSLKSAGKASVKVGIAKWAVQKLKGKGTVKATLTVKVRSGTTATLTQNIRLKP
ncbi:Hemolysin-type calcium-binding repeat-containing protein [Nocardioides exalbidus]|uniref:Hemolysin-type calcium-binding repeat-containing protein n=2 Tax=Nocardioides exalbidus TaxID=402596 RepID=A0A1H5AQP8_9ACTN|nr:Hemolysin-type calcium-binding repeat-containing protein [Nocardioides exalbidus]